jgi:hypothetical protein
VDAPNKPAASGKLADAMAMTDVTGFGLPDICWKWSTAARRPRTIRRSAGKRGDYYSNKAAYWRHAP